MNAKQTLWGAVAVLCIAASASLLAACSSGDGGSPSSPVSPPPASPPPPPPPPPPPLPQNFSQVTGSTTLPAVQAGVRYAEGLPDVVTNDVSTVSIIIDPSAAASTSTFILPTDVDGFVSQNFFEPQELQVTTNPLFVAPGSNPRAESSRIYRQAGGNVLAFLHDYDIRPSAGGTPFNFAHVLRLRRQDSPFTIVDTYSVYGFPSAAASMPVTGSANWQGVGLGTVGVTPTPSTGSRISYDFLGDASLAVDFGAGTVVGTISNMTYADDNVSLFTPADPLTSIALFGTVLGDDISGTFSADFATAPNLAGTMSGQFFGPTGAAPVEAGGVFVGQDANYDVVGGFIVGAP